MPQSHLDYIIKSMVADGSALYEPPKQARSVIICWKKVEEWAETLYEWVRRTSRSMSQYG